VAVPDGAPRLAEAEGVDQAAAQRPVGPGRTASTASAEQAQEAEGRPVMGRKGAPPPSKPPRKPINTRPLGPPKTGR
jgi:hypothetical protein